MEAASFELLKDPLGDRKIKEVPLPPIKPLEDSVLFEKGEKSNPDWRVL